MPQLDRLLSVMVSNRADSLRLVEGDIAKLELQGAARPLTKTPLTSQQLLGLLREVSPAEAHRSLEAGEEANFPYASQDGAFLVRARRHEGRWHADVRLDPSGHPHFVPPIAVAGAPAPERAAESMPLVTMAASMAAIPEQPAATVTGSAASLAADRLLRLMVERGSSDLHLRVGEPPILRRNGEMERIPGEPVCRAEDLETLVQSIMPQKNREEFAESSDTDFAYEIGGCARFRANVLKDRLGIAAVFRQIPAKVVTVEEMGITPEVQKLCYLTKGLVLVTGPTGSGKSTTLCALIDLVNRERSDHIITIEDPIEFVHPNKKCIITQRQVGVHTKSFKAALRAALREDPDIILVGELRDLETVAIAIETAETGHLVFGTLHTTTAASTVDRIIDQFPADRQAQVRTMLSESLKGVISQTLLKKNGGGRVAAREILLSTPALSNLIREGKTHQIPSVMQTSRGKGMVTLNDALLDLVDQKLVDPKEAWMKAVDKPPFVAALKTRGVDTAFADILRD